MNKKVLVYFFLFAFLSPFAGFSQNGDPFPSLIRGPYLQVATTSSIMIRWRTDGSARSRVRYGAEAGRLDRVVDDSSLVTEHKVVLSGLEPDTKYFYSIGGFRDTLQGDGSDYFHTLPLPGLAGHYRIGVFGDCGNNSVNQKQSRDQFLKYLGNDYLNAWILLGDNAYSHGADAEFQAKFFNIYKDNLLKNYPLFPSPGNHDYNDREASSEVARNTHEIAYYQNFSMPFHGEAGGTPSGTPAFYSYDIGNIHFLSLDSYGQEENQYRLYDTTGPQVQWVKKDLAANKNKEWVVAYWHHPPYTMGSHNSDEVDELIKIRENFIRILEREGVDLVLCGHSHDYERSRLMMGHYGMQASFRAAVNNVSNSSGLYDGSENSAPYIKDSLNNKGTVYIVSGSAGQLGGKQLTYPHSAMYFADADHGGASIIEVTNNRLDWKWICADGVIRDHFTMMKNVNRHSVISIKKGESATLTASFVGKYHWNKSGETGASIIVSPVSGKTVYTVTDEFGNVKDSFEVVVRK
ncbi:MAG: metallophosphoesterase family protein [Puia sp.]|nr:metallophosphoesterase family protein [Puia sp.]